MPVDVDMVQQNFLQCRAICLSACSSSIHSPGKTFVVFNVAEVSFGSGATEFGTGVSAPSSDNSKSDEFDSENADVTQNDP